MGRECLTKNRRAHNPGKLKRKVLRKMSKVSKTFYLASWIAGSNLAFILIFIGIGAASEEEAVGICLMLGALFCLLYAGVVWLVLLYKAWAAIPRREASVTPGQAVGFLFIPFFNFYWIFRAVWGYAKEFNAYVARYSVSTARLSEGVFLAACVLGIVEGFTGGFLWPAQMCLMSLVIDQLCEGLNILVVSKAEARPAIVAEPASRAVAAETQRHPASTPKTFTSAALQGSPASVSQIREPRCAECGAAVSGEDAFCWSCGSALPKPEIAQSQVSCPNPQCRYPNATDARFCLNCGTPLQRVETAHDVPPTETSNAAPKKADVAVRPAMVTCPNPACEHLNPPNARVCANCGTELQAALGNG